MYNIHRKFTCIPFDLDLAKLGHPVCTSEGKRARIVCFDYKNRDNRTDEKTLLVLVEEKSNEQIIVMSYTTEGEFGFKPGLNFDLHMVLTKPTEGNTFNQVEYDALDDAIKTLIDIYKKERREKVGETIFTLKNLIGIRPTNDKIDRAREALRCYEGSVCKLAERQPELKFSANTELEKVAELFDELYPGVGEVIIKMKTLNWSEFIDWCKENDIEY